MRVRQLIIIVSLVMTACVSGDSEADIAEVQAAAQAFLGYNHTFDFEAMRENATDSFEMIIFGQRMDMEGFETLLRRMQEGRNGRPLRDYPLEDTNTRVLGDVGYMTWASPTRWEGAVFVRSEGRWLMDRAFSLPKENNELE